MQRHFIIVAAIVFLSACTLSPQGTGGESADQEWFLVNLHQHVWDGEEWGKDRVNYTVVFDLMFNGSYFDFDGVLINDQLPDKKEIEDYREYVAEKYPGRLYLVGGHYHLHWHGEELPISLIMPGANASSLPREFYVCEEISNLTLEEIATEVHKEGGLLIWDHPFNALNTLSKKDVDSLIEIFDGIELVSVRGTRGAGSLTKEELDRYWAKIEPYVIEGRVFPAAVTDYSAYLGMPENRGAFWMNKDYGTLVKSPSPDEEAILQSLRKRNAVAILRSKDGELYAYGKPELVKEVMDLFYRGTVR